MAQDRASMMITEEDERTVLAAIAQIESVLKNLTALSPEERKSMRRMGTSNQPFARDTLELLEQNRSIAPASLSVDDMRADLVAFDRMKRINASLQRLASLCDDTEAALGADVMDAASKGYKMLNVFGHMHGLTDAIKALRQRFAGQGKKKPQAPKDEPDAGE